jgi:ABC-type phosphate transport system substrate-binding protein
MKKSLATVAFAAVPALILSACNGGSGGANAGIAPLPNAHQVSQSSRVRGLDTGPQDLHSGGATFPAYAYNLASQPVGQYTQAQPGPGAGSLFHAVPTKGTIYYCLTGSGFGRKEFEANNGTATQACAPLGASPSGFGARQDPLDFVGSDVAMPSTEYTTYKTNREPSTGTNWGEPFEIPTIGGPIVYGYRPQDYKTTSIKLSTWTYCAIVNGTISDWNDGAITKDNGKSVTGGVSQTLLFFFRSDSSGTSFLFTNHLNTACNIAFKAPYNKPPYGSPSRSAAWTFGVNSVWPGPGSPGDPNTRFTGESGNPGVLAAIQGTPFGTGYVEGAYAKSASPPVGQALLQNGFASGHAIFTDPTIKSEVKGALAKVTSAAITYGGGSDGQPLGTSAPWCILYIDPKNFVSPPHKTYPIVGLSYWLFYGKNNGVHLSDKHKLIDWLATSPTANTIVNRLEYSPLSPSVHTAIVNALEGNGGSQPACLQ